VLLGCGGGEDSSARTAPSAAASAATAPTAASTKANRFDAKRAFADLRYQVRLGPRPAGSKRARELAEWGRKRLPRGHFEAVPGHPGLRNVVGRVPGKLPAVVVAAHYDTKVLDDFVGAEDGAGGTAAVIELARYFHRAKRPASAQELRFVLFDGEENPDDAKTEFFEGGLRGSKAYANRHASELGAVIVLDFIAQKDLQIPRETSSEAALWAKLRAAAIRVGSGKAFPDAEAPQILDDHTPFLQAGIPAIDLIDFTFPCWHKTCDDLSAVSSRSLDTSGEAVLELLRAWR
jgi:glutaminyl-peptide cyclotransferase